MKTDRIDRRDMSPRGRMRRFAFDRMRCDLALHMIEYKLRKIGGTTQPQRGDLLPDDMADTVALSIEKLMSRPRYVIGVDMGRGRDYTVFGVRAKSKDEVVGR